MSSIVDYTDRQTCVIFGDGAGAVLLEPEKNPNLGILDSILKVDGSGGRYLKMIAGGSLNPATIQTVKSNIIIYSKMARQFLNLQSLRWLMSQSKLCKEII